MKSAGSLPSPRIGRNSRGKSEFGLPRRGDLFVGGEGLYRRTMRLQDKVALITGAGSGIGRESALLFAQEGAKIVVVDINDDGGKETVSQVEAAGGEAIYVHADV